MLARVADVPATAGRPGRRPAQLGRAIAVDGRCRRPLARPTGSSTVDGLDVPAASTAATSATPTTGARPTATRRSSSTVGAVEVVEAGPLRGRLRIDHVGADGARTSSHRRRAAGRRARSCGSTTTSTTAAATTACASHLPLPAPADHSEAECAFAVVDRGLTAEGGPTELGLPTFPSRRFVRAGGLTVVHEGLLEYELGRHRRDDGARHELALTLLRCTGMLSQVPDGHPARCRPARSTASRARSCSGGSPCAGAFAVGAGADPYAAGRRRLPAAASRRQVAAACPARRRRRKARRSPSTAPRSPAVRRTAAGQLEVRVFNPTAEPTTARSPGRRGWTTDLRGRPLAPWEGSVELGPWQIATLVLSS